MVLVPTHVAERVGVGARAQFTGDAAVAVVEGGDVEVSVAVGSSVGNCRFLSCQQPATRVKAARPRIRSRRSLCISEFFSLVGMATRGGCLATSTGRTPRRSAGSGSAPRRSGEGDQVVQPSNRSDAKDRSFGTLPLLVATPATTAAASQKGLSDHSGRIASVLPDVGQLVVDDLCGQVHEPAAGTGGAAEPVSGTEVEPGPMPGTDKFVSAGFEWAAQMGADVGRGPGCAVNLVDEGLSSEEVDCGGALSGDVVDIDDGMFHHATARPAPVSTGRPAPTHSSLPPS